MRAFVAIFPPSEVQEALLRAARVIPTGGDVRWTSPSNVHLTLKFLGDVPEETVGRIGGVLDALRGRHGPFDVVPFGFGAFPSAKRARVLWAGVGEGAERLRSLARDLESSLQPLGFAPETRDYTPHITLGRARGRPVITAPAEARPPSLRFSAHRLDLVRSVTGGAGATYSALATYALVGEAPSGRDGE